MSWPLWFVLFAVGLGLSNLAALRLRKWLDKPRIRDPRYHSPRAVNESIDRVIGREPAREALDITCRVTGETRCQCVVCWPNWPNPR